MHNYSFNCKYFLYLSYKSISVLMHIERILIIILSFLCLLFMGLQIMSLDFHASGARVSMVFFLILLYFHQVKSKNMLFILFLMFFLLAELIGFASHLVEIDYETTPDHFYYFGNLAYILSYIFLIFRILNETDLKNVFKRFWIHFVVLIVLDIFCVIILSGTTEKLLSSYESSLEFFYNMIIMILLTVAMINYMSKNTQKSMNLLLGSIFIFFSEVIQMTYFYISDINILNVISSLFLVFAFLFFYLQARIPFETEQQAIQQNFHI